MLNIRNLDGNNNIWVKERTKVNNVIHQVRRQKWSGNVSRFQDSITPWTEPIAICNINHTEENWIQMETPYYTGSLAQQMHHYNNAFRFMHHLPTYCSASLMFVINRVPNCRAVIRNRIYGFMKRLVSSSNALVLSTVTSDARFRSRIVRHWLKSLYIHFDAG